LAEPVTVGLVAASADARALAKELAAGLPAELRRRFPQFDWRVEVGHVGPAELTASSTELVETVRRELLEREWTLAIGLTELPVRAGRRPISAQASATHGAGLLSVPAFGAVGRGRRVQEAVVALIEGLLGETVGRAQGGTREERIARRLEELTSPLGRVRSAEDGSVRFVTATLLGNLRLLVGMVRSNQPARVIVRLSRALVASLGTAAFTLASSNVWQLAGAMTFPRLLGLSLVSIVATCLALVLTHGLWERATRPEARERVILFNLATCATLALGVLAMYVALFAISLAAGGVLIPPSDLAAKLGHGVGVDDYAALAWLVASLATIGGALGAMVESDITVREAAYRYREAADSDQAAEERDPEAQQRQPA
jgi:hypothetical protein